MTVRHQLGPRVLEKLFHQINQRICSSIPKRAGKQSADPVWELYLSSPHCKWAILTSQWLGCVENSEQMVKRWRITQLCSHPWHPHCGPDTARGCALHVHTDWPVSRRPCEQSSSLQQPPRHRELLSAVHPTTQAVTAQGQGVAFLFFVCFKYKIVFLN